MSDENRKFKCIPQNLSMSESSPVCQPWSYASGHPMSAMLDSRYFLSAHDRLRPGDTIRIVQMKNPNIHARDNEVLAFADALVLQTDKVSINMHIGKRVDLSKYKKETPGENTDEDATDGENDLTPYRKWNPGKGEHQAVTGKGDDIKVLYSHKNKDEVDRFLGKQ